MDSDIDRKINDDLQDSGFENFPNQPPQSRIYDRTYGLHYDKFSDKLKIRNETVSIINGQLHISDKYFP